MSNETRNEIKSYIAASGWKIVDVIEALKGYGIETTPQALIFLSSLTHIQLYLL